MVVQPARAIDTAGPLCAAREQRNVIELLKGISIRKDARGFLDQCKDRNPGFHGFCKRWNQQRGGGAALCAHDRDMVRDARIAVGHGAARILRAESDLPYPVFRCRMLHSHREALAENYPHAMAGEGKGECFRCNHRCYFQRVVG